MQARIGENGELLFPELERGRWGFVPGVDLVVRQTPEGILVRPADPLLSRLYVEPTNRCNLSCRTCMRHSWTEPQGMMSMPLYRRLIDSLRQVPTLKSVSFWGFGEPLLHPRHRGDGLPRQVPRRQDPVDHQRPAADPDSVRETR